MKKILLLSIVLIACGPSIDERIEMQEKKIHEMEIRNKAEHDSTMRYLGGEIELIKAEGK